MFLFLFVLFKKSAIGFKSERFKMERKGIPWLEFIVFVTY